MPKNPFQRPPKIIQNTIGKGAQQAPLPRGSRLPDAQPGKVPPNSLLGQLLARHTKSE